MSKYWPSSQASMRLQKLIKSEIAPQTVLYFEFWIKSSQTLQICGEIFAYFKGFYGTSRTSSFWNNFKKKVWFTEFWIRSSQTLQICGEILAYFKDFYGTSRSSSFWNNIQNSSVHWILNQKLSNSTDMWRNIGLVQRFPWHFKKFWNNSKNS